MAPMQTKLVTAIPPPPPRQTDAHKGTFGTVIAVGGCATMMGAPALCAAASLRTGAGLVKIAAPAQVLPVALAIEPCATGIILGDDAADNVCSLDEADPSQQAVLAVGPGMGQATSSSELVAVLLQGQRTIVLDADGLNLLASFGNPRPTPGPPLVMTPHPGEFARLASPLGIAHSATDPQHRPEAAAEMARAHGAVVVLKGHRSVVSDGEHVYINTTGNPALATAGSGDVLTGMIAALIAQGMTPFDAAVLGVYLHGLAADIWVTRHGDCGMTAQTLAHLLPDALNRYAGSERG